MISPSHTTFLLGFLLVPSQATGGAQGGLQADPEGRQRAPPAQPAGGPA